MITITIQYYGLIGEKLGMDSESVAVPEGLCDVRALVIARHPSLASMKWQVAVDHVLVQGPAPVLPNSEILILPPFAGG